MADFKDFSSHATEPLRAATVASEAVSQRTQTITTVISENIKTNLAKNTEHMTQIMKASSPTEAMKLHTDFMREASERYMQQGMLLLDHFSKATTDILRPIEKTVAATSETLSRPIQEG